MNNLRPVRVGIILLLLLVAAFMSLAGRCFYVQVLSHSHYLILSGKQQQRLEYERPQRGVIVDCMGRKLAASNKVQTIFAEPRVIDDVRGVADKLAEVIGMDAGRICAIIRGSRNPGYVKIKDDATAEECAAVRKIHRGVGVQSHWQRQHPMGELVSHAVGFTSVDNRGLGGVELLLDEKLRGSAGENVFFC